MPRITLKASQSSTRISGNLSQIAFIVDEFCLSSNVRRPSEQSSDCNETQNTHLT